jgi:hypothetical protein
MRNVPKYRQPFGSGLSGYGFDSHALLFHITGAQHRFDDGPHLSTHFYDNYLSQVHEIAHWLQFHGTTYGAFLQLLAYSQARNALGRLESMPRRKRASLLERRIRRGHPVIEMEGDDPKFSGDPELDDLRENWLEHERTLELMIDGLSPRLRIDRAALLSFVVGVCCVSTAAQAGRQPYYGHAWARRIFRPGTRGVVTLTTGSNKLPLTVRNLIEAAATAQELLAIDGLENLKTFDQRQQASMRWRLRQKICAESTYGLAFRYFAESLRLRLQSAFRDPALRLFALLVDLAMNPTVPPALIQEDFCCDWFDLHPPARFHRLVEAAGSRPDLMTCLSPKTVRHAARDLLRRAGLSALPESGGPDWGAMDYEAFRSGASANTALMEHQRYRQWVQARTWAVRQKYPWTFTTVHDVILGGSARQAWHYVRNADSYGWFPPPFRWAYKGEREATIGFQHIDEENGTDILLSAATQLCHVNLFRGRGSLELPQYPKAYRSYFRRCVRASYENRFGCAVFQEW